MSTSRPRRRGTGGYFRFLPLIVARQSGDKKNSADLGIRTVVELGSRDGLDTLDLRDVFGARVVTFECNPAALPACRDVLRDEPDVRLVECAAWHENTSITFYPVVNGNHGASSAFKVGTGSKHAQGRVDVPAVRLEDWWAEHEAGPIDLLCMDIQGAELAALQGCGALLETVRWIITEAFHQPVYDGAPRLSDIAAYLESRGFTCAATQDDRSRRWCDALFVRD
jgi:FkbM family methyltransferase